MGFISREETDTAHEEEVKTNRFIEEFFEAAWSICTVASTASGITSFGLVLRLKFEACRKYKLNADSE